MSKIEGVDVIYLAHKLGDDPCRREINRCNAARWGAWIAETFRVAVVADWIWLSGEWSEETGRDLGLELDCKLVKRCDEVWMVGGRISAGMQREAEAALKAGVPVVDLTELGYRPPAAYELDAIVADIRRLRGV